MFKFEISVSTTIVWVRAYVNLINLQWDHCQSNNCDEMSKFEVSILFKMVWVRASVISDKSSMRFLITTIAMKCPNMKSQYDLKWFELELLLYLINIQWDDCYSNICDEMSQFEVSILFKMVWVRASVISYKSSMRWLL